MRSKRGGFSMVEAIIAAFIVSLIVLATMNIQYRSALDTRRAEVRSAASCLALLLLEAWRGSAGSDTFDPVAAFDSELTMRPDNGPEPPSGFTRLDSCRVELEDVNYFITLAYADIHTDLRALNVTVDCSQGGAAGAELSDADASFPLTVYVKR